MTEQEQPNIRLIGTEEGLELARLDLFVNFMNERFPNERSDSYIREWARRFRKGHEWHDGDKKSRTTLLKLLLEARDGWAAHIDADDLQDVLEEVEA